MIDIAPLPSAALPATLQFRARPLEFLERAAVHGGPVECLPFSWQGGNLVLVNDPQLVDELLSDPAFRKWNAFRGIYETLGEGLLTSEEPLHTQVRRTVQPAFHSGQADQWARTMRDMAEEAVAADLSAGTRDLQPFFDRLTLRIAGRILFGVDLTDAAGEFLECMADLQRFYDVQDFAPPARERFRRASERLDELLAACLRSSAPDDSPVFRLLAANTALPAAQIHHEFRTLLLAGSVTTSVALSAACVHLAARPPEFPLDDAGLEAIFLESLRLNPPVWLLLREATQAGKLGTFAYAAGDHFFISPWTIHRRAQTFPEPEIFRPERWLAGLERTLPPGAFLPFSIGARSCMGARFARLEAAAILRAVLAAYRISPAPGHQPLEWLARVTLVSAHGAWATLSDPS